MLGVKSAAVSPSLRESEELGDFKLGRDRWIGCVIIGPALAPRLDRGFGFTQGLLRTIKTELSTEKWRALRRSVSPSCMWQVISGYFQRCSASKLPRVSEQVLP